MTMLMYTLLLLSIVYRSSWCQYDLTDVFRGTRMSVNDDMFVSASNAFSNFAVLMHPFRNTSTGGAIRCNMRYNTTDRYVHSVAVVGIAKNSTDADQFIFVFAAETMSTMTPYVCVASMSQSTCISKAQCTNIGPSGSHQEFFLLGIDSNGTFAYGFSSSFAFKLDIYNNNFLINTTINSIVPSSGFVPHALDVSDTWAVLAGYGYGDEVKKNYAALGCFVNLSVIVNASCVSLTSEATYLVPTNVIYYNELYELSVAIRGQKVLIGVHRLTMIIILRNIGSSLNVTRTYTLPYSEASSVGRIIEWADDTTIAVLVDEPYDTPWSKSELFFYNESSVSLTSPVFTFPNNQQIMGSRLLKPSFARFGITPGNNLAILTSRADVLIVPAAAAGYVSIWVDTTERVFVFYYQSKPCIGGTYKNRSSLGPCQICPPRTRSPGTPGNLSLQCIPCSQQSTTSFCPLASLADIDLSRVHSYSQVVAYPETTTTTDVEDLLMENMFQINTASRCLIISPLLWTLVVGSCCFLIIAIMVTIKIFECHQLTKYRQKIKNLFKHTDIIGEGEMWAGGLASLAIVVLVSFSYWFSVSFIRRYPIEEVTEPANFACDTTLINAKFSTALELLDIPKSEDAQTIFDLLDSQTFHLTVELINTGFMCSSVTTQENLSGTKYVVLSTSCVESLEDATTSVTFAVPRHRTTIQLNMTGPFWAGAIRLCFRGAGLVNVSSKLRELDFCQFYATQNEAIGRMIYIPIVFVKNINMTRAIGAADPTSYAGIWTPTFTAVSLSDESYYVEFGNYLRYSSQVNIIQIMLDEDRFFIKNIEEPIVRTAELIFRGLLFTSLCIELFAFSFLIIKLLVIPVCRWFSFVWRKFRKRFDKLDGSTGSMSASIDSVTSNKDQSIWKVDVSDLTNLEMMKPTMSQEDKKLSNSSKIISRL